jgi:hypothetical protein
MRDYTPIIFALIISFILWLLYPEFWMLSLIIIALTLILVYKRTNLLGLALIFFTFVFGPLGYQWLSWLSFILGVIVLLYSPLNETVKTAWEEMKKADAPHPKDKFEGYIKGASKHAAEGLVQTPNTGYNPEVFIHKSDKIAKNFFTELKELFKRD